MVRESFNGSFRDGCLNLRWFETLEEAKATIEDWRRNYNEATRVDLTRLSTTWRQLNLYAGRAFQALSRFNEGRKLALGMVLETQADQAVK